MIAADTSSWIAYIQGSNGRDVDLLETSLRSGELVMPPAVLTELLSAASLPLDLAVEFLRVPLITPAVDYWRRAGLLRALLLRNHRKAKLGDSLVAQSCIDAEVPLITRDEDFRAFAEFAGLQLAL